jgi:predicted acylesterase/phospholipase RssA
MGNRRRLGLALSGGGFRAAAFHLGVMRALDEAGILDEVEVVSAVSGGALLASAWMVAGRKDLEAFSETMRRFLSRDLKTRLVLAALRPDRLLRLLVDPRYSLTEVLAVVLDRTLLRGRTLGSLRGEQPRLIVNATCINHGTGWRFAADRLGDWILATRDRRVLDAFPLARAVAASCAFPGGLAPVVLRVDRVLPGSTTSVREVLLTDGGVDDNLGLQALVGEDCGRLIVSDGSFPFVSEDHPLRRFGLPPARRLAAAAVLGGAALWGAGRFELSPLLLALLGGMGLLVLLRLRLALWLFGAVVMRSQRRGLLRRLFAGADEVPALYLSLTTALGARTERTLRAQGLDLERLRRVRTDLNLGRREVDGLIALGEALAGERLARWSRAARARQSPGPPPETPIV